MQFRVGSYLMSDVVCVLSSLVQSSSALPASQPVCFFPYGVVFVCSFVLLIKAFFPPAIGSSPHPFPQPLTERTHHEEDPAEEGLVPAITSLHTIQPPLRGHPPVQSPALPPSAGYWRKDVCPEVQRYSRGVGVQPCGTEGHVQHCPRWAPQLVEDEGAGSPSVLGVCGVPDSFPSDGGWSTSSGSRGGRPGARCRPGGCSRACSSPGAHRARSSGGRRGCGIPLSEAEEEEEEGFFPPSRPGGRSRAVCWPGGCPWAAPAPRPAGAAPAPRPAGAAPAPRPAGAAQAPRPAGAAQAPRPKRLALPAPPKRLALPAPPKLLALPAPLKRLALPVPPRLLVLPAPLKCLALPAPPRLLVLPGPPWQPAKLLAPPWPPDRLEPAWSVPPAPPWPSSRDPVRPDPPWFIPPWPSSRVPVRPDPPWFVPPVPPWLSSRVPVRPDPPWSVPPAPPWLPARIPGLREPPWLNPPIPPWTCWASLLALAWLPSLPPAPLCLCVWLFLSGLLLCVSLCVVRFLCCHVSVLFLVSLIRDARWRPFWGG